MQHQHQSAIIKSSGGTRTESKPMTTSFFSKKQRETLIASYMGSYEDWFNDEPTVYDSPETRRRELEAMNNSELHQFIQSDLPSLLQYL